MSVSYRVVLEFVSLKGKKIPVQTTNTIQDLGISTGTNVLLICKCPQILLAVGRYVKHIFELTSNKPVYDKCAVQLHVADAIASKTKMDSNLS